MFGLPLYSELIQGSAIRTWNCVAYIANFIWYKFTNLREPIMPRTRRRHHSRSRSRSRTHSHDRDREPKRRKIESFDSPHHKRSVSSVPEANENSKTEQTIQDTTKLISPTAEKNITLENEEEDTNIEQEPIKEVTDDTNSDTKDTSISDDKMNLDESNKSSSDDKNNSNAEDSPSDDSESEDANESKSDHSDTQTSQLSLDLDSSNVSEQNVSQTDSLEDKNISIASLKSSELSINPQKTLSPKQALRKMEWDRRREEKEKEKMKQREKREQKRQEEREEREKKKQQERDEKQKAKEMRDKMKQEKDDQKLKEKELKDKEKEMRRKEREEKEKQKEQERIKKQQEMEEKNNKKQKASAAFVNFFVPKKSDSVEEKKKEETCNFMPFEVKSDMRLAPIIRKVLTETEKERLVEIFKKQEESSKLYFDDLKSGKKIGKSGKTWSYDESSDDVLIIDDLGESIAELKKERMKAKFLKFHENQRPPYFGTWRKKSKFINPKNPLAVDKELLNYSVDSEEEWEDEVDGESIVGSDEDEKDNNDSENDYEVDNDVFVPHGHLSDDEGVDDEDERFSPETHKAKLKLLKNQFEEEMKSKTQKIKPRLIGCVWYDKDKVVDDAIDKYLQPLSIICNNNIVIKKRSDPVFVSKKEKKKLDEDLIPDFLRLVHGNTNKKAVIVKEYIEFLKESNIINVTPAKLNYQLKKVADWTKCPKEGPMFNTPCWYVKEDIKNKFNIDLELPNKWEFVSKKV